MITSRHNPKVAAIRRLRNRRQRESTGLFVAEGLRLVGEAADSQAEIEVCVVSPTLLVSGFGREAVDTLARGGTPVLEVSEEVFGSISSREGPQGVMVVARQSWRGIDGLDVSEDLCWVVLDSVQDPGNLGTILRTCEAVGAQGVILLHNAADPFDPTAVRASMGAIFSQQLVRTDLEEFVEFKERSRGFLIAASDKAEIDYREVEYRRPVLLFMGSEKEGLDEAHLRLADVAAGIPMVGRVDSLNLAIATGIFLYEVYRQAHPVE